MFSKMFVCFSKWVGLKKVSLKVSDRLLEKRLFTGKIQINTNSLVHTSCHCFSFFCFVLRRTSNVHFWYMHLTLKLLTHKNLHIKQKINYRWHQKQGQCEVWLLCPPRYQGRFDWRMWPNHLNSPQNKTRFSNTFPGGIPSSPVEPFTSTIPKASPAGLEAYP